MFSNVRLSVKLAGLVAVSVIGVLVLAIISWVAVNSVKIQVTTLYEDRTVPSVQLSEIKDNFNDIILAFNSQTHWDMTDKVNISSKTDKMTELWTAYKATYLTPEEKILAQNYETALSEYFSRAHPDMLAYWQKKQLVDASSLVMHAPEIQKVVSTLTALIDLQKRVGAEEYEKAVSISNVFHKTIIIMGLVFTVVCVVSGVFIVNSVLRQIGADPLVVKSFSNKLSTGDLRLSNNIAAPVGSIFSDIENLRQALAALITQTKQGVDNMYVAVSEISEANMDLSQRTESQASSLEQTASATQQLNTSAQGNDLIATAVQENAVALVDKMQTTKTIFEAIKASMQELQDNSKKVEDTISIIRDISFQTNILALNAAIEAARAGEAGKGFAVVAQEVRALSTRSAQAAATIDAIIKQSVSQTVANTQEIVQTSDQVSELGLAVQGMSAEIGQVSIASKDQCVGLNEISQALMQLDAITQQNAAIAEQTAAAVTSLRDQAANLQSSLQSFIL